MAFEDMGGGGLNYFPCRYGRSRLLFRGPKRKLVGDYITVLGSSETYGKFVETPFTDRLQTDLSLPVVNLGCMYAGVSVFVDDDAILSACSDAKLTIIQVMSAQNMSNRFYTVHPRRNDRFLKASETLRAMYPTTDFTDFNFTRHLLTSLKRESEQGFALVEEELRQSWLARMRLLISKIDGPVALLWMSDRKPGDQFDLDRSAGPHFVDAELLDQLAHDVVGVVEVVASEEASAEELTDMVYAPMEAPAAAELPGPIFHEETARTLARAVPEMLASSRGKRRAAEAAPMFRSERSQSFSASSGTAVNRSATNP
ncbi:MAG: hypothetical protein HRU32_01340 [Rhodobacteraceae bacterium]|nr:hypothetical protein [Paracoccaceae bacterium]